MSPGVTLIDRLRAASAGISGVRLAFLFGSRARGQARRDSDIDVAVLLDEEAARADRGATIRQVAAELGRTWTWSC